MTPKEQVYQEYMDDEELVTIDQFPGPWSTGDGPMHLGLFMCLLFDLDQLEEEDKLHFRGTVKKLEEVPGLYNPNVDRHDLISQDNMEGIAAGSILCDDTAHKEMFYYGLKRFFYWNNTDKFDIRGFRIRFPVFIMWLASLIGCFLFYPILLYYFMLSRPSREDQVLLNYIMLTSFAYKYKSANRVKGEIITDLGLSAATAKYFRSDTHPIVLLAKQVEQKYLAISNKV